MRKLLKAESFSFKHDRCMLFFAIAKRTSACHSLFLKLLGFLIENKFATFRLYLDTSHFGSIAQKCETRYDKLGYFLKKNK